MRIAVVLALPIAFALAGCQKTDSDTTSSTTAAAGGTASGTATPAPSTPAATTPAPTTQEVTMASGLKYQDLMVGTGAEAQKGKRVTVHYTGWLQSDGTKFDSSLDRNEPFPFQLGTGSVIQGWDEGVAGMKVGGKRKLTIPPDMAYGARGYPPVIPPNSTLVFDVELLGVQ